MTSKRNLEQRFESLADDDGPGEGSARTSAYTPDLSESDYEFFDELFGEDGRDLFGELFHQDNDE